MTYLLRTHDIAVHFGGTKAVDGVSIDLEEGLLYGLVGPNGSGKSTLLGAMSRLTQHTSGTLEFLGRDYSRSTPQETARLGLRRTFQTVRLLDGLSVLENVCLGADAILTGRSIIRSWVLVGRTRRIEKVARDSAMRALERLSITDVADAFPSELSYGTQRRVEIARALVADPKLLLLDEPTAGMTRAERDEIGRLLQDLRKDGLTQVLVEHDVPLITDVSDHLFVMNQGKLIASGEPAEVVRLPAVQVAYLGVSAHDVA